MEDKRDSSNGRAANPRIIIDASYIRGMKKDGAPFRAMCEQGGRIVLTDTLIGELYSASDSNQWYASKRKLVECRDAIEVWAPVSEMYRAELRENRPYGDPLHPERTERFRKMLAHNPQDEPNNRDEIIEKTSQVQGSTILELFQNFAELGKEPEFENLAAKIKGKAPHDKEVVQTCYEAVNDPDNIRPMIEGIKKSAVQEGMDVLLNPNGVDKTWAIWHFSKSLLTVLCDSLRQGENVFKEISKKHKERLQNIERDLDYLVLLAFADAIATRETKGEMSYYRRWMFGDVSKPSISYYEKKRIGLFVRKLPMSKVTICVTQQLYGYTCALDPWSRMLLEIQNSYIFPGSVFVSYNSKGDFESIHGSIWKHLAEILTGYSVAYLQASGKIVFIDSKTMDTLFEF